MTPSFDKRYDALLNEMLVFYLETNLSDRITPLKEFMDTLEKKLLLYALAVHKGRKKDVAITLGIKNSTLSEKIKKFGISDL